MSDGRHKDQDFHILELEDGSMTTDRAQVAVLMDIRDELKAVGAAMARMMVVLCRIDANARPNRKTKKKR